VADELAWASWDVGFLAHVDELDMAARMLAPYRFPIRGDEPGASNNPHVMIFDRGAMDPVAEERTAVSVPLRIAFDDLRHRSHDVDILVDPTPGRAAGSYAPFVKPGTELLVGSKFVQLRRSLRALRSDVMESRKPGKQTGRVLVQLGQFDPNTASKILTALRSMHCELDVVLGSDVSYEDDFAEAVRDVGRLHVEPVDVARLAADADLAIGFAGNSCFEYVFCGLPVVLVAFEDDSSELARALEAAGVACLVSAKELDDPARLTEIIRKCLEDRVTCEAMSASGFSLVDGRGAQRLLIRLAGGCPTASGLVSLRAVEFADEDWILRLQWLPETRRYSLNSLPPSASEHAAWMKRTLNDIDRLFAIVELDGQSAGTIRLDRVSRKPTEFEITIAIAPDLRGRGIGGAVLKLVRRAVPSADLLATVLAENVASQTLFERAGYRRESDERFRNVVQ
jgi:spore coat polysaccharide biosynthesis predicted glycosyltransferase SpsG/RimJ/RimL family protein N-acetyltransferase